MPRKRALLIHNSKFIDANLAPLTAAKSDVRKLSELLQEDYVGFAPTDITLLENPSLGDFRAAVSRFYRHADQDDYLFFYYAGHGIRGDTGELYLALRNTTLENFEALALEASFIRRNLERCFAKQKVVLLDCCNASAFRQDGQFVARDAGFDAGQMVSNFDPKGTGTYVLGASQSGASAYETVNDAGEHFSLFTHHLIEGVKTGRAAPDRDHINWTDIGAYIHAQRNSQGVATTPYIDMTNAAGLLEFCKNPQPNGGVQPVVAPITTPSQARTVVWPWITAGASILIAGGAVYWASVDGQPLSNTPPNVPVAIPTLDAMEEEPFGELSVPTAGTSQTVTAPTIAPVQPKAPLKLPIGLQPLDGWSRFADTALGHVAICASKTMLKVDLGDAYAWAVNQPSALALVKDADGWLSLDVSTDVFQPRQEYEFNVEFCSCETATATADLPQLRADDGAQIFLGGADFADDFADRSDVKATVLSDTANGNRAFTVVLDNSVRGGGFGFQIQGTLKAQNSYLGQCRD